MRALSVSATHHIQASRLLKKVQMQGGARCEVRRVLTRTSQRRASVPTPQMGLFQQPARLRIHSRLSVRLANTSRHSPHIRQRFRVSTKEPR